METNTELLNRIEAHIKGRLAVAESRAASSELYEGKKIAYNSILGIINGLRADCAAQAQLVPSNIDQEAAKKYADEQLAGHNRELAESGHTRHFKMGYVCFAGYEIEAAFADGMLAERERLASCPTIKGWVARDGHGSLVFSNEKPSRVVWCGWNLWKVSRGTPAVVLPNSIYSALRWEDEPIEVEIIVKTKQ